MEISVIGTGRIGTVLARLLAAAGHHVLLAHRGGPDTLAELLAELGPSATASDPVSAVRDSELSVLMVPFASVEKLFPPQAAAGRVLVDATNAFPARVAGDGLSSSERVAARYSGSRVVKSLNTMNFVALAETAGRSGAERMAHYTAGDDPGAKALVAEVVSGLGFAVLDTGDLREGSRYQEPGGPLYNVLLTAAEAEQVLAAPIGG